VLSKMLWKAAQINPEKSAIAQGRRRISYANLYQQVGSVSEGLGDLGIQATDCIAVVLPNCPEFIVSFFACARLNAILLPLNPQYTKNELQRFLVDGKSKLIITDSQHLILCQQIIAEIGSNIQLVVVDKIDSDINSVANNTISFGALLAASVESMGPAETISASGRALYLYTSGSTSAYKRLCCTQENLYYEAHNFVETLGLTADDAILCTVPLYHSYGFGNGLLDAVYCGSTLVLLEPVIENGEVIDVPFVGRTQHVLDLIEQESIRFLPAVPYQFAALAELPKDVRADLSELKWCVSSGDVLPKKTYQRFLKRFGIAVRSLYGSTEAGSICINTDPTERVEFGSLGAPLRNVEIQIRDKQGNTLTDNTCGTIWVKSPVIPPTGYDNRAELSDKVFVNGYYDTGDLGKKNQRGHLIITGRKQTFIDVGGYKVDINEVEEILQAHPQIREVAALGIDMEYVGQIIKTVIVAHQKMTENEILVYCREHLAAYKVPSIIEFRDQLPRSPLGKVLKKELRNIEDASAEAGTPSVALLSLALKSFSQASQFQKQDIVAAHIHELVAKILQREPAQISRSDAFQRLGFDSIRAADLQNKLNQLTGLSLSITLLWNHPTIDELATVLLDKMTSNIAVASFHERTLSAPSLVAATTDLAVLLQRIDTLPDDDVELFFEPNSRANNTDAAV